jgi:hypothetical protein
MISRKILFASLGKYLAGCCKKKSDESADMSAHSKVHFGAPAHMV